MPQSTAMLTQLGQGYAPMAEGLAHSRRTGFEGVPFMGAQGPMGLLAQMGMAPVFNNMMGQSGMIPMGVGHDQNVYDTIRNMNYTQMQMRTMQLAAEADRHAYMQTFRGLAAITGTPFGAEQRRAAQSMAHAAVLAAPIMTEMMPDFVDQMGGLRGSATVMSRRMIDSGRYRVDPISGRMGMSAETTGELTNRLFQDLYADKNIAQMHGVSAGQLGNLYEQLQQRGMLSGFAAERGYGGYQPGEQRGQVRRALDTMSRTDGGMDSLRNAADRYGIDLGRGLGRLSGQDLDNLMKEPEIGGRLRAFDAERIKRSLQGYVQAVGAMRDIFGDMGHPNAPMQQLVQSLEAMTSGSMSQLDPGRLSMMVRQTYNLAKQTGVTMDNAMMLQQHASQRAGQMGLEPVFGMHATQGSLGFGGAYRAQGHAAHTAWGAMSADQVQQLDTNLRVQASGSNMSNRMAVAMRLRDTVGGFQEGTAAASYTAAIASGLNQFVDASGRSRSVGLTSDDFVRLFSGARGADGRAVNISENDIRDMLQQRDTNNEYADRYGLQSIVRRAQGSDELHPFVGGRMQETLTMRLRDNLVRQGVSHQDAFQQARAAARDVSQNAIRRMFQMSTQDFSSTADRNRLISEILEDELSQAGHGDTLRGMDDDQRRQFLQSTAERFYGHANRAISGSMYSAFGNLQNVHRLTNETTLNEADRQQMQAKFTARLQDAMAPLGRGTILSRAVDALQNARPDDPNAMMSVISSALGGVRTSDINSALLKPMTDIRRQQEQVESLRTQISQTQDPEQRQRLMRQLDTVFKELGAQAKAVAEIGERHGMFVEGGLSAAELQRTIRSSHDLTRTTADLHGVRTGAGAGVSAEEIQEVMANPTAMLTQENGRYIVPRRAPFSQAEATAVMLARRESDVGKLMANASDTSISEQTRQAYANAQAGIRQRSPGMTDAQISESAIRLLQRSAGDVSDEFSQQQIRDLMRNPTVNSAEEASALIRTRRRGFSGEVPSEMVEEIRKEHGSHITEGEARELGAARLRANRMGVRPQDTDRWMAVYMRDRVNEEVAGQEGMGEIAGKHRRWWGATAVDEGQGVFKDDQGTFSYTGDEYNRYTAAADPIRQRVLKEPGSWRYQARAIDRVLAEQQNRQYTVTPEDRENFLREHRAGMPEGINSITQQTIEGFKRHTNQPNIDEATARQQIMDRMILGQRSEEEQARFAQFWDSEGGAAYREKTDLHMQDVENISQRLISSPQMVRRFGTRAVAMHNVLTEGQQRLRDLSTYYSGGDMSRLMAGNLDTPMDTKQNQETRARVASEVQDIRRNINSIMEELQDSEGKAGPQWEMGDEAQAAREVLQQEVAAGRMTQADMDKHVRRVPNREQRQRIRRQQHEMGSERNARQILGIDPDATSLTEWQEAKMAGVRYGAGVEEELIGAVGQGRWATLSEDQRREISGKLRQGTQNRDEAIRLLNLQNLGRNLTSEEEERVQAATVGFQTNAHAWQLGGLTEDKRATPEGMRMTQAIRMGTASEAFARHTLDMPDSGLSPELSNRIQQRRELAGNEQEARRILGVSSNARAITETEHKRMQALMQGVGMTEAEARLAVGVTDGNPTAEQQQMIAKLMAGGDASAAKGNNKMVMSALGMKPGETLSYEQSQQLQKLTQEVGVARRLTPDQERAIQAYGTREQRMGSVASARGADVEEMAEFMRRAGPDGRLTDEARKAMADRPITLSDKQDKEVEKQKSVVHRGKERLDASRKVLNAVLGELRDKDITPERRQELLEQLSAFQQDVTDAEHMIGQGHKSLRGIAGTTKATTTELLAGKRSGSKLEELSTDESKLLNKSKLDYRSSTDRLNRANQTVGQIKTAMENLDRSNMDPDVREKRRGELQSRLDKAELSAAEALSSQQGVLQSVEGLAAERGVTAQEMLKGDAGYTTAESRRTFSRMSADQTKADKQIGDLAKDLKVSKQDLAGGATITQRLDEAQRKAQHAAQQNPQNLIRQIYQAYGMAGAPQDGQPLNAQQNSLAQLMNSSEGRGLAHRVITTQGQLKEFAQRGGFVKGDANATNINQGIGKMADEYFRALNGDLKQGETREGAMQAFQQKLGVDFDRGQMTDTGQRQWSQFQQAMQFQQQKRFLQLGAGDGRRMRTDQQLFELYRDAMPGGELKPTPGAGAAGGKQGEPLHIQGHLTGKFTFDGPNIDMVARTGAARRYGG